MSKKKVAARNMGGASDMLENVNSIAVLGCFHCPFIYSNEENFSSPLPNNIKISQSTEYIGDNVDNPDKLIVNMYLTG